MAWKYLIDPPDLDAPLEDWEAFLAELLTADQSDEGIIYSVRQARLEISRRKGEIGDPPDANTGTGNTTAR